MPYGQHNPGVFPGVMANNNNVNNMNDKNN